ncbi:cadd30b6-f385-4bd7-b10b-3b7f4df328f8-CDS [Sclerotinia trifoliorum]|uniref:Cadd30b6-f385-4bd7-b10b-3b7f4df328f8-CDS n=1 Tax=Sclerotinia trifoliorum TaxID=28548 RepID=A0A8H2VSH6_9HELO|nr:cadd30b6-f385-4bd7-b10b-3b7f4df328f8-CDS [Sclerotinia trifoliorum]
MQFLNTTSCSLRVIFAMAIFTLSTSAAALSHTVNYPVSGGAPVSLADEMPHTELQ